MVGAVLIATICRHPENGQLYASNETFQHPEVAVKTLPERWIILEKRTKGYRQLFQARLLPDDMPGDFVTFDPPQHWEI